MEFKNFGLVSVEEANAMGQGYTDFLQEKGLIISVQPLSSSTVNMGMDGSLGITLSNSRPIEKRFTPELGLEIRDFLLDNYKGFIGGDLISFRRKFQDECFGRSDHEKKQIGLEYFNLYYKTWCDIPMLNNSLNVDGNSVDTPRMNSLNAERNYIAEQFRYELDMISKYLVGDRGYFNRDLYESSLKLQETISFENEYLILQYLNDLFGFENQKSNDRNLILDKIYKENRTKIDSFDTILFIDNIFSIEDYRSQAYGIALFDFLKHEVKTIYLSMREFSDLIVENFPSNFNKLKHRDKGDAHDEKKNLFKNEWDKFFEDH
ncbi:hypothetical protein [Dokdonia sp. 4H-3-7-5]|uniref:hypothetical protein n=1 Tax=Dokdonia sp. (strain 4H-3-7-5) TaxID=983548 RepID=UPI00020A6F7A|nr:hypothetical protein [Dokdonia sp. 4H-3-7-5]AEE19679.1 hypothetical protein Krodi_1696 [Dokdonia sp. 4H-3-7-5]